MTTVALRKLDAPIASTHVRSMIEMGTKGSSAAFQAVEALGDFFALVPVDAQRSRLRNLRSGGLLPEGETRHSGSHRIVRVRSTMNALVELLEEMVLPPSRFVLFLREPYLRWDELPDSSGAIQTDDGIFYNFSMETLNRVSLTKQISWVYVGWNFLGSVVEKSEFSAQTSIGGNPAVVMTSAFDGESFVLWVRNDFAESPEVERSMIKEYETLD